MSPAAHAFSFTQNDTVTLLVGPDEHPLVVHESYITLNSEFFKMALKKQWIEGQTRLIKLPEDDLETMTNYLTFTYGRGLPTSKLDSMPAEDGSKQWALLVKLYILGDRRLDKCVRNAVITELVRLSSLRDKNGIRYFMPTSVTNMCLNGTPDGSPIRRLIIDEYVFNGRKSWLTSSGGEHPAFLHGLSRALLEKIAMDEPYITFRGWKVVAEHYFV